MEYFPFLFLFLFVTLAAAGVMIPLSKKSVADPTTRRLARVERDLKMVMDHLGIPRPDPMTEVRDQLRAGRKLEAIVVYRDATGAGLKESKEAVERMAREHGL